MLLAQFSFFIHLSLFTPSLSSGRAYCANFVRVDFSVTYMITLNLYCICYFYFASRLDCDTKQHNMLPFNFIICHLHSLFSLSSLAVVNKVLRTMETADGHFLHHIQRPYVHNVTSTMESWGNSWRKRNRDYIFGALGSNHDRSCIYPWNF